VLLVMLVVVMLLTVSSLRATTMEARLAGNTRDRDLALQAAEAAVRSCLNQVQAGDFSGLAKLTPVVATSSSASAPNWDGTWSDTNSKAVTITGAKLASDPRCMLEDLGSGSYRITGRAVGASADTLVMLQATMSNE